MRVAARRRLDIVARMNRENRPSARRDVDATPHPCRGQLKINDTTEIVGIKLKSISPRKQVKLEGLTVACSAHASGAGLGKGVVTAKDAAGKLIEVGKASVSVSPGETKPVIVHLSAAGAKALLSSAKDLTLVVTLEASTPGCPPIRHVAKVKFAH
jgi:hypothetical protein